jgi:mercuric ion binding protein
MRKLSILLATLAFAVVAHAEQITFKVEGMVCEQGCVKAVKDSLTKTKGVKEAKVEIGKAEINYDAKQITKKDLITAIEKAGYKVVN